MAALNDQAAAYCADGRYEAALPLFERVVAGCTARLGADDPDTLISHGNLVVTQLRMDPCGPALRGLDANVTARHRVLGVQHPATLAARAAQATAYELAAAALEQDLWEHMATVGPEHPETVALRTELAQLRATRPAPPPRRTASATRAGVKAAVPTPRRPRGARFPRLPEQAVPEPAVPDQAVPEPAVPDHAVPEHAAGGALDRTVDTPPTTRRRPRGARFARWGR